MSDFGPELPIYSRFDKEASLDKEALAPLAVPALMALFGAMSAKDLATRDLPGMYNAARRGDWGGVVRHGGNAAISGLGFIPGVGVAGKAVGKLGMGRLSKGLNKAYQGADKRLPEYLSVERGMGDRMLSRRGLGNMAKATLATTALPMATSGIATSMGSPPPSDVRPPPRVPTYRPQRAGYGQPGFFQALQQHGQQMGMTPRVEY